MKLEKLIIAFLAAYIIYCFISKENYAFDEPGVIFPSNDPNLGYIDIYNRMEDAPAQPTTVRQRSRSSPVASSTTTASQRGQSTPVASSDSSDSVKPTIVLDRVEFTDNISRNRNVNIADNSVTINNFTSRIPKSVTAYGVNYDDNGNVEYYKLMSFFNNTNVQLEMKPGNQLILRNLNMMTNLGATPPRDRTPIHTARFVFNF